MFSHLRLLGLSLLLMFMGINVFGEDKLFPDRPNPPRLVNDYAGMMSRSEQMQLEEKLYQFEQQTSIEITVVTVTSIGDNDISDYAIKLGKYWGVGKSGKNDGVVVLASMQERKAFIATGKGMEGVLTDYLCGRIVRNEMVPSFKQGFYFQGFSKAADAIIAASKGEYKADSHGKNKRLPATAIVILVIFIIIIASIFRGGGGRGGGRYMSGRGMGDFATGMLLGNLLGGGGRSSGGWGGGGSGGFGGFGGGDFGGGGAGGSW